MAANVSVIGRTTRVQGRVSGSVDLEVQGFVAGEISVDGDVTVDAHGMVGAGVRGRRLVIRGAIKGDLVGEEAVSLEEGARVVGDVRAPRVSIAPGALVRGFVQTGAGNGAPTRAARTQAAGRPQPAARASATVTMPSPASVVASRSAPAASPAANASPKPLAKRASGAQNASNNVAAAARRPPPPVVPALKKAKGQIAKRKER
jgi:cytoskeletal protein CcmA (bactofilin family)